MEVTITAESAFDALHKIEGFEPCARPHGHHWTVRVSATGEVDPKTGWPRGTGSLQEDVEDWARQLHRSDLADMLPGVVTSPIGIAGSVLDYMALRYPKVVGAEVICSDGTRGAIKRAPRQQ